ncbi:MAG: hypothetical protein Q8L59_15655 [Phenylobacterium sp.]|uniref:hypothetical protein n=1 Tax=Phenylobacterium sp. TaxID=1871053 RepID=UPI0027370699|nr:hypothetical protein [Phenylobacterium sp.]MDP1643609.1 hypothetical protein [Phenylobacterium sp.]MDP3117769.1 hypothetical protein [Phenylobacterium sp.]
MTTLSPGDAAFEGFRLTQEHPRVTLIWALFHLLVSFVTATALILLGGDVLMQSESAAEMSPAELAVFMREILPTYMILAPIGLVVMSVAAAAVYRLQLRPEEAAHSGHLRFGADEVRLIILTVIYYLMTIGGVLALSLLAAIAAGVASLAGQGAMATVGAAMMLFFAGLWLFVLVRLSLAPVLTFDQRRLVVFGSWSLTRGHFWRLLGTYALALVTILVVSLLAIVIFAALAGIITVAAGGGLDEVGEVFQPDFSSFGAYISAQTLLYLVFNAGLTAIFYPAVLTPQVVAYLTFLPATVEEQGVGSDDFV